MELPRLLASFALALAAVSFAASSSAQTLTVNPYPRRDPGEEHDISGKEYYVTYDDCVNDDVFTFRVPVTGSANLNLEVWVSDGGSNCADVNLREGGSARCWQVYAADASNGEMEVEIRAQDLVLMSHGQTVQNTGTAADCGKTDLNSGGLALTLYFMLIGTDTPAATETFAGIGLDVRGPEPPSDVSASAGESKLKVSWSLEDADDWEGYRLYCLEVPADDENAPGLRPLMAPGNGGAGATGGAPGTGGVPVSGGAAATGGVPATGATTAGGAATGGAGTNTGGTSTEPTSGLALVPNDCRISADASNLLVPGELPGQELNDHICGSGSSNVATDATADNLQNGVKYQVAVAGVDIFGNVGPLSAVACDTPAEVDTFYEQYKLAGGKGGGGFCTFSPRRAHDGWALLGGAGLIYAARRRRRRRQ